MGDVVHGETAQAPAPAAAEHAPAPARGLGVLEAEYVRGSDGAAVDAMVDIVRRHPGERGQILAWINQSRGMAFARQVETASGGGGGAPGGVGADSAAAPGAPGDDFAMGMAAKAKIVEVPLASTPPGASWFHASAKLKGTLTWAPTGQVYGAGPQTQLRVGPTMDAVDDDVGVAAALTHRLEGKFLEFSPELRAHAQITKTGIKASIGARLVTSDWGGLPVALQPFEFGLVKWDYGELPKFAAFMAKASVSIPSFKTTLPDGREFQLRYVPSVEAVFAPDTVKVAQWVGQQIAAVVTAEAAIGASILAGGLATIGFGLYQIATAGEIPARTEAAIGKCRSYAKGFVAAAKGQPIPKSPGGAEGAAAGNQWIAGLRTRLPEAAIAEVLDGPDLYQMAWGQAWPQIKSKAISEYWEHHWFEKMVYGDDGAGNGGFRTFKRVLDTGDD
jgi:hypothetical protein